MQGQLTQYGIFDTYIRGREKDLAAFLDVVPKGRIVCVAIKVQSGLETAYWVS